MNTFSIREMLAFGWETFKKRPWFFLWTSLFISVLSNLSFNFGVEDKDLGPIGIFALIVGAIAITCVTLVAKMGASAFLLKAHDAPESVVFMDLWAPRPFWRFLGATLLKGLIIGLPVAILGFVAFFNLDQPLILVPAIVLAIGWGVFMSIKYLFVEFIVMDTGMMPMDALRRSDQLTKGMYKELILLMLALAGVCILGLLALIVGILVAVPVTSFAFMHAYKSLKSARPEALA